MRLIRKLIALALLALAPAVAVAQIGNNQISVNGNHVGLNGIDAAGATVNVMAPNATGEVSLGQGGTKKLLVGTGGVGIAVGIDEYAVPYTITAAATPTAANVILGKIAVFPTAAANTAALLPSPTAGTIKRIINSGPNAVRVKAAGTDTMNGTAGGYVALATLQQAVCVAQSATAWNCDIGTVPTPAGP